jgi:hypothetical protein
MERLGADVLKVVDEDPDPTVVAEAAIKEYKARLASLIRSGEPRRNEAGDRVLRLDYGQFDLCDSTDHVSPAELRRWAAHRLETMPKCAHCAGLGPHEYKTEDDEPLCDRYCAENYELARFQHDEDEVE